MYRQRLFYSHYGIWFLYVLVICIVLLGLRWLINPPTNWIVASIYAVLKIGLVAVVVAALTVIWGTGIGKDGIRGYDGWGRMRNVPWQEMVSVRTRTYLGAPYIVVSCPRIRFRLHVPKWMHKFDEFAAAVIAFAPPDNALRTYLSEQTGASSPPVIADRGAKDSEES